MMLVMWVRERFPMALAAFLGGGVLSRQRTVASDLGVVVLIDGAGAPCRESLRWRGWPVELGVHDENSLTIPDRLLEHRDRDCRACLLPRSSASPMMSWPVRAAIVGRLPASRKARASRLRCSPRLALAENRADGGREGCGDVADEQVL